MKLDGFGIMVDDMAVMVRFYRDVLGFEIKEVKLAEAQKSIEVTADGKGIRLDVYVDDDENHIRYIFNDEITVVQSMPTSEEESQDDEKE